LGAGLLGLGGFSKTGFLDSVVLRAIFFLAVLLLVIPLFFSFFVSGASFHLKVRAVFLLQKLYLFAALSVLLLVFLVRPKGIGAGGFAKSSLWLGLLSLLFFALAFSTQLGIEQALVEGATVHFEKEPFLDIDNGRYLAPAALGDTATVGAHFIERKGEFFLKIINLDGPEPPENIELKFLAIWSGEDKRFDSKVKMAVNENSFDISSNFAEMPPGEPGWIKVSVPGSALKSGENSVAIVLEEPKGEKIGLFAQATYLNNSSFIYTKGVQRSLLADFHEYLLFADKPNSPLFSLLFKLGFAFRLAGIALLFAAVFGLGFLRGLLAKAKAELLFSTVFAYAVYWFSVFIRGYWRFLSFVVTKSVYYIFKALFLNPVINTADPSHPIVGVRGFVVEIAETCSGIESIGYFLLAYTALIVFSWRRINQKRALLLYAPGIIGIFAVNILRVALIILVGAFYDKEFAVNVFHTNAAMFLFILYFIVFWPIAMRFISKKDRA
jgi:exosortase/archaeosortase family protein